jgi:hypothetical protein
MEQSGRQILSGLEHDVDEIASYGGREINDFLGAGALDDQSG